MFSFLNRNRTATNIQANEIRNFLNAQLPNPQIDFWIDEQILFQVMPAKHFIQHGFQANSNDFIILHFFKKNKTNTLTTWEKIRDHEQAASEFFHFEEPKGNHNYLKNIGTDPANMEKEINKAIELYELEPQETIRFEINSY